MSSPATDAVEFERTLAACWDFFASYETSAPILRLTLADGTEGAAADLEDVPLALFHFLTREVDIPGDDTITAAAQVFGDERLFEIEVSFDGLDGPLRVHFPDGSATAYDIVPSTPEPGPTPTWREACANGSAQMRIESVVAFVQLIDLEQALGAEDRLILEAILPLLSELTKSQEPPSGLVKEAVRWIGGKVDIFATEVATWGGRGVAAVGTAGLAVFAEKHLPGLREVLTQILAMRD